METLIALDVMFKVTLFSEPHIFWTWLLQNENFQFAKSDYNSFGKDDT